MYIFVDKNLIMLKYNAYHPNGNGWVVPRPTYLLPLLNGQVYCYDYKIQSFVPTTFRIIVVWYKDCPSTFLLSDTLSFIQAVFTLTMFMVFWCLSVDSILYLISLMDFLVLISKYVVVLKIPAPFASVDIGFLGAVSYTHLTLPTICSV